MQLDLSLERKTDFERDVDPQRQLSVGSTPRPPTPVKPVETNPVYTAGSLDDLQAKSTTSISGGMDNSPRPSRAASSVTKQQVPGPRTEIHIWIPLLCHATLLEPFLFTPRSNLALRIRPSPFLPALLSLCTHAVFCAEGAPNGNSAPDWEGFYHDG